MKRKLILFFVKLTVLAALIFGLFLGSVHLGLFGHVYTESELREFKNETASLVLAENGKLIGKFFADNRTNVSYDKLPEELIHALIATEDARYFEHEGVDSRSLLRVLVKSIILRQKGAGGGSTITQQLAKNMFGRKSYGPLSMPVNKTKEVILAYRLENIYSKEDILTLYLNTVPFGENVLGIEAAAHRYFNKGVARISLQEAAVLIGMLKANTYYNPRLYPDHALSRRNVVLEQMEKYEYLSERQTDSLKKLPLVLDYANLDSEGPANYFLVQIRKETQRVLTEVNRNSDRKYDLKKSGLIIETTLDYDLQLLALQAFKSHLGKMQARLNKQYNWGSDKALLDRLVNKELNRLNLTDKADIKKRREMFSWKGFYIDSISIRDSIASNLKLLHAGFVVMDPRDGSVRSWIGGIDFRTQPYDQIFAQRQTASAFKPVLYAAALEQGAMPCQYLDNDQIVLQDYENWQPQNYDRSTGGKYSMAASLSKSMNIPTVNLFFQQDFEVLDATWKGLGFTQELLNKPATALGTTTASLYEMAIAYGTFANGGEAFEPVFIKAIRASDGTLLYQDPKIVSRDRILKASSAELLTAMLQKAVNEGTGASMKSVYGVQMPLAGKTGTSQDYGDAWFLAYNPEMVVATRVGATYPMIHFNKGSNGSGSALALPLVAKTLQGVQKNRSLKRKYFKSFATITDENGFALNCKDYVDDSEFEKFFDDFFAKKSTTFEKASKRAKKKNKKSFFKRLFGKKQN
jgi:penicillin-binding protein 1A